MRGLFILVAALALSACATDIMNGYMGQPVQMAILDYGPPTNAFDMPDGSRAFQWVRTSTYTQPANVRNDGNAYAYGNQVNWYQNTQITGGRPVTSECAYTMIGRWSDGQNAWILESFREPNVMCQ